MNEARLFMMDRRGYIPLGEGPVEAMRQLASVFAQHPPRFRGDDTSIVLVPTMNGEGRWDMAEIVRLGDDDDN